MDRLALRTVVSHVRYNGEELRVVRVESPPKRIVAQASYNYYDIHADRRGAVALAAAWSLAKRSPRSLIHLPIRANLPPLDIAPASPTLDVVFVHASAQFRASEWKSVRARSRVGAAHRIELGTIRQELPGLDEADFSATTHADFPHHLRYTTAAETLFVIGSAPAFEREGAFVREFVERFDEAAAMPHYCVELWPTRWRPGHSRRIGPGGLHIIRETELWPTGPARPAQ
ncbi:hypothetical protein ABH926_006769 [Catenulispora sp. GP43]|uniref:hypothetical protein n=1 Tax=Catenulispora sp. GP43 TaxID=3156263 RepID=UPI0035110051